MRGMSPVAVAVAVALLVAVHDSVVAVVAVVGPVAEHAEGDVGAESLTQQPLESEGVLD